ncbi:MAG: hypothetical protein A2Z99_07750 [Treponema sp. GWB1_62_6]|nr:MAG: hypothetical protein A2Z99_07750 [Treponema sp. GWB1_62_6]OHE68599.1 MAG: hypothetical protein A2001_05695 [Treponema sp. GWC1_61_84]
MGKRVAREWRERDASRSPFWTAAAVPGYDPRVQTIIFWISKLLRPVLASPLFLTLLAAVAALLALKPEKRRMRALRAVALAACLALALISVPAVASGLARLWETERGNAQELAAAGPFDVIVVLGGSTKPAASIAGHIELNDAMERLIAAALLYRARIAPIILFTGGSGDISHPDDKEAPLAAELLKLMGVPREAILLEAESRNTHENATLSKPLLDSIGASRIVLVTSAWHMRRSAGIFGKAGYDFVPYAADSLVDPFSFPADLFPDAGALDRSTRIFRELAGVVAYRLLGRL